MKYDDTTVLSIKLTATEEVTHTCICYVEVPVGIAESEVNSLNLDSFDFAYGEGDWEVEESTGLIASEASSVCITRPNGSCHEAIARIERQSDGSLRVLPKRSYGNCDPRGSSKGELKMNYGRANITKGVPDGYRHVPIKYVARTCQKLGIWYLKAISKWNKAKAVIDGVIIKEEDWPTLKEKLDFAQSGLKVNAEQIEGGVG